MGRTITSDGTLTDAERIAIGLDRLQNERLYDLDDLWQVLERLGHERSDTISTTVWDDVAWTCPMDDCDGGWNSSVAAYAGFQPMQTTSTRA